MIYVHTWVMYVSFLVLSAERGPRNNHTPIAITTPLPRSWFLNILFGEVTDSKAGAGNIQVEMYKNPKITVLESKEVLQKTRIGTCPRGVRASLRELPLARTRTIWVTK